MTSTLRVFAILGVALLAAGAAQALESAEFPGIDSARVERRLAQPAREEARNDNGMQALCREVLVAVDEGYGVTNHEPRIICDQLR